MVRLACRKAYFFLEVHLRYQRNAITAVATIWIYCHAKQHNHQAYHSRTATMKLVSFICAHTAIVDSSNNSLSLIGIMEDQRAAGFPLLLPQVAAVAMVRREPDDPPSVGGELKIYLGNNLVGSTDVFFDLKEPALGARAIIVLQQIVIPQAGTLRLVLTSGGRRLSSWETHIVGGPKIEVRASTAAPKGMKPAPRRKAAKPKVVKAHA